MIKVGPFLTYLWLRSRFFSLETVRILSQVTKLPQKYLFTRDDYLVKTSYFLFSYVPRVIVLINIAIHNSLIK